MKEGLSNRIADYVANTVYADLPEPAIQAAKRSLLDAIGVSLGASGIGEGVSAFAELAIAHGGKPESSIFGYKEKVSAQMAALANGAMAHALDFEDAYDGAPLHPNAALVPAALALAQARGGVSGRELIAAIAVGCDLTCRLALSLRTQMERFGWYPPPIFAAYGAVAAAGKIIGLDAAQMRDAFSLALHQTTAPGEIKYSPDSVLRAVRDAFPAQTGVLSALLAERGVRGFERPFEGAAGFFRLFADGDYSSDKLLADMGRHFHGADVSYKKWPSCRGTHPFIEAALALRCELGIGADDIAAIEMCGDPIQQMLAIPLETKRAPHTLIDAKFSSPFVVATAFVHGRVTLDEFKPGSLRDAKVLALAARATHAIDASFPTPASGMLMLRLKDGRYVERRVDTPLGDPARPLSWDDLCAKMQTCAERGRLPLAPGAAAQLAETIASLQACDDAAQAIFAVIRGA